MRERQSKTLCPHCGHWDSLVMQGWDDLDGYIRRRRCLGCRRNYRTREVVIASGADNIACQACAGVYFLRGPQQQIKIGASHDVVARLSALERELRCALEPLGYIPTTDRRSALRLERMVHRELAALRLEREWFQAGETLDGFLRSAVKPWPCASVA